MELKWMLLIAALWIGLGMWINWKYDVQAPNGVIVMAVCVAFTVITVLVIDRRK